MNPRMHRRFMLRLWLLAAVILGFSTTIASAPAACPSGHCVYLPFVAKSEPVSISDVHFAGYFSQGISIAGELESIIGTPVYSITLEFRMYDSGGFAYIISRGSPVFSATLPGEPNPFIFETDLQPKQEVNRYDIRVVDYRLSSPQMFLPLEASTSSTSCEDHNHYKVEGIVTNQNDQQVEDVTGIVWDRKVLRGLSPQKFAERLGPFENVPFSTSIYVDDCGEFARTGSYQVAVQGTVPK